MGIEKIAATAKFSPENIAFLNEWVHGLQPYSVSHSSIVDLCVRIVRELHARGEVDLTPKAMQAFLSTSQVDEHRSAPGRRPTILTKRV